MSDGKLLSGQALYPEQTLVSVGEHAHLHYQSDGNLVSYLDDVPFWASQTAGYSAGKLHMDPNGNLVLYDATGPIASTRTQDHPGAMVQLQDDGNFVIYEDPHGPNAGTPIWASSTGQFVIGECVVSPPDALLPAIAGRLELVNKGVDGIADGNGQRLVVGLHAGDLLAHAKHHGWAKVEQALDYAKSRGFQFVRTWTNLPAPEWWGVAPRPGTISIKDADYWTIVEGFIDRLLERDLRWLVSQGDYMWLWPGNTSMLCGGMDQLGAHLQARGGADRLVLGVDAGNEAWNFTRCTDPVLMGAMVDAFNHRCPTPIRSMTSAIDEGTLNQFDGPPVTITDKHGSRDYVRMAFERSFTVGYWDGKTHPYTIDSEMPGCGPKVSATSHPEEWMEPETMGMLTLIALVSHQIPVMMSSPGVYLSDETFDQYDAQLSVGPKIAAMLPTDIQSWKLFHGGADRPFSPEQILRAPEKPGNFRCDHARGPDNKYGVMIYQDAPGPLSIEAINGFEGQMLDPGTLQWTPILFAKGQMVSFNFRRGRFLLGRRTT